MKKFNLSITSSLTLNKIQISTVTYLSKFVANGRCLVSYPILVGSNVKSLTKAPLPSSMLPVEAAAEFDMSEKDDGDDAGL